MRCCLRHFQSAPRACSPSAALARPPAALAPLPRTTPLPLQLGLCDGVSAEAPHANPSSLSPIFWRHQSAPALLVSIATASFCILPCMVVPSSCLHAAARRAAAPGMPGAEGLTHHYFRLRLEPEGCRFALRRAVDRTRAALLQWHNDASLSSRRFAPALPFASPAIYHLTAPGASGAGE